ncbi:MAG TPA: Mov34/MPN/PAD-1 family protein, partial [Candidatus Ozemobacteraceae bacterium]
MSKPENPPATQGLDFQTGTSVPDSRKKPFPARESIEPRVVIEKTVFDELLAHGRETTSVELCGVLVGSTARDDAGPYLTIDGSIRGQHTRNDGAQVTFTHETWDHIHKEIESRFRNRTIVGWYHTHPGFGIFLSDMDKFIQDYFFNQPFQVALVIDPISQKEGLFAWVEGKTRPLTRCWIGKELRKLTCGAVGSSEA